MLRRPPAADDARSYPGCRSFRNSTRPSVRQTLYLARRLLSLAKCRRSYGRHTRNSPFPLPCLQDLFRSASDMMDETPFFVLGGTLSQSAVSYVFRQADDLLYTSLLKGEFCY